MTNKELYDNLVCALMHSIDVCDECQICGKNGIEVRMSLVERLANYMNQPTPWQKEN